MILNKKDLLRVNVSLNRFSVLPRLLEMLPLRLYEVRKKGPLGFQTAGADAV